MHAPLFLSAYSAFLLEELVGDKAPRTIGVLTTFRIDRAVRARLGRDLECAGNSANPPGWRNNGEGFLPELKTRWPGLATTDPQPSSYIGSRLSGLVIGFPRVWRQCAMRA